MKFFTYYRSSASYRVRIALNLKGIDCDYVYVNLLAGEHREQTYRDLNPQGFVPALELDGQLLTQSMAILELLEERYPEPALLPGDAIQRARVRAAAQVIGCDTHPLDNLRVLKYLKTELGQEQQAVDGWYRHWIGEGFKALELMVDTDTRCCFGDEPGLVDLMLVPQMYNARRFKTDLAAFPRLVELDRYLTTLPAFAAAAPENQADAT